MNPLSHPRKDIDEQSSNRGDSVEKLRQHSNGNSPVLNSWKQIADYLGCGVRTVQGWERHFGLPVHRQKGKDHSATLAVAFELNQWLRQTPVSSGRMGDGEGVPARNLPEEKRQLPEVRAETLPAVKQRRELILSIDDEPVLLYARERILEREGYAVLSASDGEKALRMFVAHPVDLVLLDYVMPGIDGGIVAREMKRCKPLVPIIMVTANNVEDASICVDSLIVKGQSPALLLQKMKELLAP